MIADAARGLDFNSQSDDVQLSLSHSQIIHL